MINTQFPMVISVTLALFLTIVITIDTIFILVEDLPE